MNILHLTIGLPPQKSGGLPAYCQSWIDEEYKTGNKLFVLQPGAFSLFKTKIVLRNKKKFTYRY